MLARNIAGVVAAWAEDLSGERAPRHEDPMALFTPEILHLKWKIDRGSFVPSFVVVVVFYVPTYLQYSTVYSSVVHVR